MIDPHVTKKGSFNIKTMLVFFRLKSKLSIKVVENNFLVQQIVKYLASANISHGHDENIGVTHIQDMNYS